MLEPIDTKTNCIDLQIASNKFNKIIKKEFDSKLINPDINLYAVYLIIETNAPHIFNYRQLPQNVNRSCTKFQLNRMNGSGTHKGQTNIHWFVFPLFRIIYSFPDHRPSYKTKIINMRLKGNSSLNYVYASQKSKGICTRFYLYSSAFSQFNINTRNSQDSHKFLNRKKTFEIIKPSRIFS